MNEKEHGNTFDSFHDEYDATEARPSEGRRKSNAVNIVENPLAVSFAISSPSPPPSII